MQRTQNTTAVIYVFMSLHMRDFAHIHLLLTPQQLCVCHPWHLYVHMGRNLQELFGTCSCSLLFLHIIHLLHLSPVGFHQEEKQTFLLAKKLSFAIVKEYG